MNVTVVRFMISELDIETRSILERVALDCRKLIESTKLQPPVFEHDLICSCTVYMYVIATTGFVK